MKAHPNLTIALLMATCCCFSVFCAESPIPNRHKRMELQHTYNDLADKKDHTLDDYQKMEGLAKKLKEAESALFAKDPWDKWREDRIRFWHVRELQAKNSIIIEMLQDTSLPQENKIECLKKQHLVTHVLKLLYTEEMKANPHNSKAQEEAARFMAQSFILGQYESLLKPQKDAAEPVTTSATTTITVKTEVVVNTHTEPRDSAESNDSAEPAPTLTEVKVETPVESTEKKAEEKKDSSSCIIL